MPPSAQAVIMLVVATITLFVGMTISNQLISVAGVGTSSYSPSWNDSIQSVNKQVGTTFEVMKILLMVMAFFTVVAVIYMFAQHMLSPSSDSAHAVPIQPRTMDEGDINQNIGGAGGGIVGMYHAGGGGAYFIGGSGGSGTVAPLIENQNANSSRAQALEFSHDEIDQSATSPEKPKSRASALEFKNLKTSQERGGL